MLFLQKYKYPILTVFALIAVFYWLVEGGSVDQDKPFEQIKRPNAIINDTTINQDKDGKRIWTIDVKTIEIDSETDINTLIDVKGKLYRDDGAYLDVIAKGGTYDPNTGNVTLTGDVFAVYSEGWTLKCQKIDWIPGKNLIVAKEKVECEKTDLYISGDEIETDPDLAKIKITGNGTVIKRS